MRLNRKNYWIRSALPLFYQSLLLDHRNGHYHLFSMMQNDPCQVWKAKTSTTLHLSIRNAN